VIRRLVKVRRLTSPHKGAEYLSPGWEHPVDNPARAGALRWRFRKRASAHLRSRETPTKRGLGPATEERPLIDGRHLGCGALLSSSRRFSGERPCIRPRVAQARRGRAPRLHASHEVRGERDEIVENGVSPTRERRQRRSSTGAQRLERSHQATPQRSRDERCPSGSGRGRAPRSGSR